ncbi:hypothetical protein HMP0015_1761 [Acinetobacter haemolyticus ATCC 19194]|uniref:Uncharacterized protein n=1 Tax=Acinetobacter haemolyticus ATCC 19194 TaxID=707232 RepID=D4XPW9_ACIHA|nr:hypothetical protein HMP0015_1761 [Acinetobacter haemolyticus ATCC 19194]
MKFLTLVSIGAVASFCLLLKSHTTENSFHSNFDKVVRNAVLQGFI